MEYQLSNGIYFTDYGKKIENPNQIAANTIFKNNSMNPVDFQQKIAEMEDPDILASVLAELKSKINQMIQTNQYILAQSEFSKDDDLVDALTENFQVLTKYFAYINQIKQKLVANNRGMGLYDEDGFAQLTSDFQKLSIDYSQSSETTAYNFFILFFC
jgi:hypothetical protein